MVIISCDDVGVTRLLANDLSDTAAKLITQNIASNGVQSIVEASCNDANEVGGGGDDDVIMQVMYNNKGNKFTAIDLDPYGTAAPFLDASIQSVVDGGLLLITCTDMAVLAGGNAAVCMLYYVIIIRDVMLNMVAGRYIENTCMNKLYVYCCTQ